MYLLKVNNRNTRTKSCETCSNLTVKTPERCEVVRTGFFIDSFEQISDLVMVLQNANWVPRKYYLRKVSNRDIRTAYWIMFKLNNKDIRKKSLAFFWGFYHSLLATRFYCWLQTSY